MQYRAGTLCELLAGARGTDRIGEHAVEAARGKSSASKSCFARPRQPQLARAIAQLAAPSTPTANVAQLREGDEVASCPQPRFRIANGASALDVLQQRRNILSAFVNESASPASTLRHRGS
jgi:hypothetical protein